MHLMCVFKISTIAGNETQSSRRANYFYDISKEWLPPFLYTS